DRPAARGTDDVEDLRMQRRLAAGELQQVRLALALDQEIEHALDLREAPGAGERGRGAREAGGAREVAVLVHLQDREAAVLLVIGAEAAVVGAALVDSRVELERHVAGLEEIAAALPVARLGRDQRLLHPVPIAALEIEDGLAFLQDFCRY